MEIIATPKAIRKSTVGVGDSMVAGIVFFLSKGKSLPEAAKFGVACGTTATMNAGTEFCKKEDDLQLYKMMQQVPEFNFTTNNG